MVSVGIHGHVSNHVKIEWLILYDVSKKFGSRLKLVIWD